MSPLPPLPSPSPSTDRSAPEKYRTDHRNRVAETADYCITEYRVSAGQQSPWHSHTGTSDLFYVLAGRLELLLAEPTEVIALQAGQSHHIPAGRVHMFKATDSGASYLLIQGVGRPDFILAAP